MVMTQYKMMSFVFCWYRLPVKYNLNRIAPNNYFYFFCLLLFQQISSNEGDLTDRF